MGETHSAGGFTTGDRVLPYSPYLFSLILALMSMT